MIKQMRIFFEALPQTAFSIEVGEGSTKARFNLFSQSQVLPILWSCILNVKKYTK
jgi:hypothetical protein